MQPERDEEERQPSGTTPDANRDDEGKPLADGSGSEAGGSGDDAEAIDWKARAEEAERREQALLAQKGNYERHAEEDSNDSGRRGATESDPGDEDDYRAALKEAREIEKRLRGAAAAGDDVAVATIALERTNQQRHMQTMAELSLLEVQPELRAAARKAWKSGEFKSPQAALRAVKGDLYDEGQKKRPSVTPRNGDPEPKRPEGYVGASHRSVSAGEQRQRTMKASEFTAEAERLQKAGDWAGLEKLDQEETSGKIKVLRE